MTVALQGIGPADGGPVAPVVTFLLGWAFFTFTAQLAARYVLGGVPWRRAALVGSAPAVVTMALAGLHPLVVVAAGLAADLAAVTLVYRVDYRRGALVVALHYAVTVALVLIAVNVISAL